MRVESLPRFLLGPRDGARRALFYALLCLFLLACAVCVIAAQTAMESSDPQLLAPFRWEPMKVIMA